LDEERQISSDKYKKEIQWALDVGLAGADSLEEPTFSRGERPHFTGISTFLRALFVENVCDIGKYDGHFAEARVLRDESAPSEFAKPRPKTDILRADHRYLDPFSRGFRTPEWSSGICIRGTASG
jgi:hypothetical protein